MNIEYFQEFSELAQRLNYREVAERLNMSQSALSKHVKALEAEYGMQLFDRDRNSVALTPAGALLVEYAQQIWSVYEKSKAVATSALDSRPIMLAGVVESPDENQAMSQVMKYVSRQGIERHVRMRNAGSMSAPEQLGALRDGVLDCFVGYDLMPYDGQDGIRVEHLCDLPLDVIVSVDSALATKQQLRYSDMAGATFVHLAGPNFTPSWRLVESLLEQAGVPFTTKPVPTSSIYDYIDMDLGKCLLVMPRKRGHDKVNNIYPKIKLIAVDEPTFKFELDVAYVQKRKDASLECLIDALRWQYGDSSDRD